MKKLHQFLALVFAICIIISLSVPCVAVVTEPSYVPTTITRFSYTVFDRDGNVVESGITPDFRYRYSWSGLTVDNSFGVVLEREDGSGFYATKGTTMRFSFELDRNAHMEHEVWKSKNSDGPWYSYYSYETFGRSGGYPVTSPDSVFNLFVLYNASSDPVTITRATLTF